LVVPGFLDAAVHIAQRAVERQNEVFRDRVVLEALPGAVVRPDLIRCRELGNDPIEAGVVAVLDISLPLVA
jgi:hypothetical protein